jgi:hypothetical protein
MMTRSAVEQIRELEAQKAKLISAAKAEAKRKVDKALSELNELGFNYRLVADGHRMPRLKTARAGGRKRRVSNVACKICKFRTVPPHDARTHRGQSKKAAFTKRELAERGLRCA